MNDFPETAADISPAWLTEILHEQGCLPQNSSVAAVESQLFGTGKMGDNARFTLTYEGKPGSAPATLVGKFPAADATARAMAGAQGAYYNESSFYSEVAPRTRIKTPKIYFNTVNEARDSFVILMQDMAPAEVGDQFIGENRHHTELALKEAAQLAAAFYDQPEMGDLDYVMATARDDGGAFGEALLQEYWPQFLDRFGHSLNSDCRAFGDLYVQNHCHFVTRFAGPRTLAHGDFRSENILFNETSATVVDWQTLGESSALTDAAYFIGGSLTLDNRRNWERELVEFYRVSLADAGVELATAACWEQYREYAMHALLITVLGASFSEPGERSDRMFTTMIQRHLQQCVDLGSSEFLGR